MVESVECGACGRRAALIEPRGVEDAVMLVAGGESAVERRVGSRGALGDEGLAKSSICVNPPSGGVSSNGEGSGVSSAVSSIVGGVSGGGLMAMPTDAHQL
jgi:hypothetical protein